MKIDLSDISFMIPVKIDSEDRINNLNIVTMYIREHFDTTIIVAEQGLEPYVPNILGKTLYDKHIFYKNSSTLFHKTRLINVMAKSAKTPLIAMYDSDVLFEPDQYVSAINKLRENKVDFIYPFNGYCINISRANVPKILENMKFDFVRKKITNPRSLACGGCVMYNREKFITGGMMNENFVSYGPEDGEQDIRFKKLRYRTDRINKPLYHLDHVRTANSQEGHEYVSNNWTEMKKIKSMSEQQLRAYVSTWTWTKK